MLKTILNAFLDFVLPARCLACGKVLYGADGVCAECFGSIDFIDEPRCRYCGRPFEFAPSGGRRLACPECLRRKPKFDACVCAALYGDAVKKIVLPFKHGDRTNIAKFMAAAMLARGAELAAKADIIMPVPIHFFRMLKRKYNQSALLARFIGKASGKPVFYNTLARVRATKSQGHMGEKERRANVKGAFRAKPRPELAGADVLLIDDVFTTGATVSECAAVLKKAGAARVYVLAFARA